VPQPLNKTLGHVRHEVFAMFLVLRAIRAIAGIISGIYFIGMTQALRTTFVYGSTEPDELNNLLVKALSLCIGVLIFSLMRKLINSLHIKRYGNMHPALSVAWSLRL
jgi:hypothetical protein